MRSCGRGSAPNPSICTKILLKADGQADIQNSIRLIILINLIYLHVTLQAGLVGKNCYAMYNIFLEFKSIY